jgi:hypothetical protein
LGCRSKLQNLGLPFKTAKPWVAAQNCKTLGCHPNPQDLGLAAQTGPKGALTRAPSGHPRFSTARCRSLAMFQQLRLVPQTPPLRGTFASGSNLLGKKPRRFSPLTQRRFESGRSFLIRNLTADCHQKNKQTVLPKVK